MKYLEEGETLLVKNEIEIKDASSKDVRNDILEEAERIVRPIPNKKFLQVFRTKLWLWNKVKHGDLADTSFIERAILNKMGEPPVLLSAQRVDKSKKHIENYLYNQGFFYGEVDTTISIKRKKAVVQYEIELGQKTLIEAYQIKAEDTLLVNDLLERSTLIQQGRSISKTLFDKETARIVKVLRNKGYAYFFPNYISYEADTIDQNIVICNIRNPENDSLHRRYFINDIFVKTNYDVLSNNEVSTDTIMHQGVYYIVPKDEKISVKPNALEHLIYLKKGDLFDQTTYDYTAKRLNRFGVFKYADITFEDVGDYKLDINIKLQPEKKMSLGADIDLSSNNGSSFGSTIGTSASVSYQNKNLFRGGEKFNFTISNSLEFLAGKTIDSLGQEVRQDLFSAIDFGVSTSLVLPGFRFPLHKLDQGNTVLEANFDFFDRANFYKYRTANFSYGYDWYETESKTKRHILDLVNLDILRPDVTAVFQEQILDNNQFLNNSFANQLFIGPEYSYIFQSPFSKRKDSYYFRFNIDVAPINLGGDGASQYFKTDVDLRWLKKFSEKHAFATRFSTGIGATFEKENPLPYVKQFYVGGPSSIRAWRVRDLGPGGFVDTESNTIQPFQTGDFKLEASAEYRFDLLKSLFLEGALFVDAGNIWTLEDDPDRVCPDGTNCSGLGEDFMDEIALGAGWGFRFDFSYFIIRLDMAYPLRTPYKVEDTHWRYEKDEFKLWKDPVYNLAIGYPF